MRIRSTKPEFWRSETIASLDWDVRLVLKGVESYVDDNGVGKDSVVLICADVFPHDLARDSGTLARVSRALRKLTEANLIARYTLEGEPLLYVRRWKFIQRVDKPNRGRLPRPDGTMEYSEEVDESIGAGQGVSGPVSSRDPREPSGATPETLASPPETLAPVTGEQGNRGTGEEETCSPASPSSETAVALVDSSDYPASFEEFWDAYPRKAGKRKALAAWKRAVRRASNSTLVEGAVRYAQDPNRVDRYTKYAEGWLNGDMWLDEPIPSRNQSATTNGISKHDAKVRGYADFAASILGSHSDQQELQ